MDRSEVILAKTMRKHSRQSTVGKKLGRYDTSESIYNTNIERVQNMEKTLFYKTCWCLIFRFDDRTLSLHTGHLGSLEEA